MLVFRVCGKENIMPNLNANTLASLNSEVQTFYNKHLIEVSKPNCAYRVHAQKTTVPKNGGNKVNWRDFQKLAINTKALTEGAIPDGKKISIVPIDGTIKFYGDYVTTTDQLELMAIDKIVMEANKRLGLQAAETLDYLAGSEFCTGTNVIFAGGVNSRADLTEDCVATVDLFIKAAQFLKTKSAPKIDKSYFAIVHPAVAFDLMTYTDEKGNNPFIDVSKYANKEAIVEGEIGKMYGIRFIETPNAVTTTTDGTDDGATVYQTIIYGDNAFGVVDLEGGNLRSIVKPLGSGGTSDPLDMISTIGWKAADCCKILNNDNIIRIESCSKFSV